MTIGYVRIKGEEFGVRVDVDSQKLLDNGNTLQFDTYDKAGALSGQCRIPAANVLRVDINAQK